MSILKYTASADTTITDAFKPNTTNRAYYANMGAADSLEVFSIAHSGSMPERARILINFPVSKLESDRASGKLPPSGSVKFIFKLYNVQHPETLPNNYDLSIKPISGSWDEGYGLDLENYSDNGQTQTSGYGVGWKFKSSVETPNVWSLDGGDFINSYEKIFHIEKGTEDIELDVTDIIEDQISNTIPRDGLAVTLSDEFENSISNTTYYTKRFSARSSEYFYKVPALEARWESLVKDNRGNFFYSSPNLSDIDNEQNIYFYNKFNGNLKDLPLNIIPTVKILDENDVVLLDNVTSQKISNGCYKATVAITGSSDATLTDVWYSGSSVFYEGTIDAKVRSFSDSNLDDEYIFTIRNLKKTYKNYEFPSLKIFVRKKDWSPTVYKVSNNIIENISLDNLYYKITRIVDNLTIIDYGIEPIAYTKCSYDKEGNYFDLDMSFLQSGYMYAIQLMTLNGTEKKESKEVFKFKVE